VVHLSPKILFCNEPRPDDYDNWLECPTCVWLCPIHEAYQEAVIKNAIETIDNPFDNKTIIEFLPNRTNKKGSGKKTLSKRRSRNKLKLDEDPEIDSLLRIYRDKVRVIK
jgi:hypothetical protein